MSAFRQSKGIVSRQAQAKTPTGTYEDMYSRSGFAGDQTMLYRRHPPTAYTRLDGDLRPRVANTNQMVLRDASDPRALPTKMMFNGDVAIFVSQRSEPMPYAFRNVDGDEVIHVQRGEGVLRTEFGPLKFTRGDYLVVPKGIAYSMQPSTRDNVFYIIQTSKQVGFPDRGLLGPYVPFDLGILETPDPAPSDDQGPGEWEVVVKCRDRLTSIFYPFDPMDVVGWQGTIAPFRLSIYDIRSISSERLDIPPSGYATFQAAGAWICTFTPHPMQSDPDSTFVPPYHRNVDHDEIYFVLETAPHTGGPGLQTGMLLAIPQGAHHGVDRDPAMRRPDRFDQYILNIDVEQPLTFTPAYEEHDLGKRPAASTSAAPTGPREVGADGGREAPEPEAALLTQRG